MSGWCEKKHFNWELETVVKHFVVGRTCSFKDEPSKAEISDGMLEKGKEVLNKTKQWEKELNHPIQPRKGDE